MSTQATDHKVVNLYNSQVTAYEKARAFARVAVGRDATEGEILEEIATTYLDHLHDPETDCEEHLIGDMVGETAADNGDPTFSREELKDTPGAVHDSIAAVVETDEIDSFSTSYEIMAYFSCPAKHGGGSHE